MGDRSIIRRIFGRDIRTAALCAAMVGLACLGLAACGGSSSSSDSGSSEGSSSTEGGTKEGGTNGEVVHLTWVTGEEGAIQLEAAKKFNETHPEIQVKVRQYPYNQLLTELNASLGAGESGEDVISADAPLVINYYAHGWLAPLDEYFPQSLREEYVPAAFGAGEYDGHLLAVPRENSSQVLFINRTLFKEAGVKPPTGLREVAPGEVQKSRWTWEEVAAAGQQIKQKTGAWGFAFEQVDYPYQLLPLGESLGKSALSPDGLSADGYLNSPQWVKAATWYGNSYNKWEISPPGVPSAQTTALFNAGKIAMLVAGTWNVVPCEEAKFECDAASQPDFAGGKAVTPTGSFDLAIPASSENKEAAAEFIKWFSLEGNNYWTEPSGNLPATKKGLEPILTGPSYAKWPKSVERLGAEESETTASPRPQTPGFEEFQNVFLQAFGSIRAGEDPESTLDSATEEIDSLLSRYK
jgi:multiple sugar transport system substrate-binding protein